MRRRHSTGQKPNGASSTALNAAHIATPIASVPQATGALCGLRARRSGVAALSRRDGRFKARPIGSRCSALTGERAARNEDRNGALMRRRSVDAVPDEVSQLKGRLKMKLIMTAMAAIVLTASAAGPAAKHMRFVGLQWLCVPKHTSTRPRR